MVVHFVVEFLSFVGLQLLSIGQLGNNVFAGDAGFRVRHPLAMLGTAGEWDKQPVTAFADSDRQVLGTHLYKIQKE